jgi:hypothetical protein
MKHRAGGQADRFRSFNYALRLVPICLLAFCLAYPVAPDAPVVLPASGTTADLVPICAIQGQGDVSPFAGQLVRTAGVVYADFDDLPAQGFYLQP